MTSPVELGPLDVTAGGSFLVTRTLKDFADGWDGLAAGAGSLTHHYAWVSACANQFADPSDLYLFAVGDPSRPKALAPLFIRRTVSPRLELLSVADLHQPMDLIYRDRADAVTLAKAIASAELPLWLARIPADSPTPAILREAWRGGLIVRRPVLGTYYIALTKAWAAPEPPLNPGRRSDLRRVRRQAERFGRVSVEIVTPTPANLDALLDEVFRGQAAHGNGTQGIGVLNPVHSGFYRQYAANACRIGALRMGLLRIGDRIAAMQFAVECDDRFWLLEIGHEEAFSRFSPSVLLLAETVRYAAARGLRSYEFLGAPEPWIQVWTTDVHPCISVRASPVRPSSLTAFASDVALSGRRRFEHRFYGVQ